MKWTITTQHKDFFESHSFIAFEEFLSKEQVELAADLVKEFLCNHFHIPKDTFFTLTPEDVFLASRDLSRNMPILRKIICNKQLGSIAAELMLKKHVRLGFDQIISTTQLPYQGKNEFFSKLLNKEHRLPEISSIQGILGGALILLSENTPSFFEEEQELFSSKSLFPKRPGDIVFFNQYFPLSFNLFYGQKEALYLLVTFTETNAVYIHNEKDPHTHALKSIGYVFGDRFQEKYHPTLA
ncbi:MAG: hypothetical protein P4L16_03495 [Chlamydiales bacterium]|nr:hypothetical protein [Chlamydiales bacterium]